MTLDRADEINAEIKRRGEAVEREAFEHHVLALVRGSAPIQEFGYREVHARELNPTFVSARLEGRHPRSFVIIRMRDINRDLEHDGWYPIWDEDYELPDGDMQDPGYIAGEMLMLARGG